MRLAGTRSTIFRDYLKAESRLSDIRDYLTTCRRMRKPNVTLADQVRLAFLFECISKPDPVVATLEKDGWKCHLHLTETQIGQTDNLPALLRWTFERAVTNLHEVGTRQRLSLSVLQRALIALRSQFTWNPCTNKWQADLSQTDYMELFKIYAEDKTL